MSLEGTIFLSCCRKHGICYTCLKKIATGFDNHPINHHHPLIKCPYPFDQGCFTASGIPYYFSHSDISKVLSPHEFIMYMNHAEKYQFPGYEIVKCPRPILLNNDDNIGVCDAWILVPIELIKNSTQGHLVIECDQNINCRRSSCYHCHSYVRKRGFLQIQDPIGDRLGVQDVGAYCETCITNTENTNPTAYNRYFYRPDKQLKDGKHIFYKNNELTPDLVISQLLEIIDSDRLYTRCFECLTQIYKTEQCNTITHCGIERCYACGRSGSCEQDLGDHWDVTGIKGCPRFDHSNFWNDWADCDFKCREGRCYSEEVGLCDFSTHQTGIKQMIILRKFAHVYHMVKSLLPQQQHDIVQICNEHPRKIELNAYMPTYICNEYRTYLPDIIHDKIVEAKLKLHDETSNSNINTISTSRTNIDLSTSTEDDTEQSSDSDLRYYSNIIDKTNHLQFKHFGLH